MSLLSESPQSFTRFLRSATDRSNQGLKFACTSGDDNILMRLQNDPGVRGRLEGGFE